MGRLGVNEPVRRAGYLAGIIVGLSTFLLTISVVTELTVQVYAGAAGAALGQFAAVVFGAEYARGKAWGPASVDAVMDADAVIAAAEAGDHASTRDDA